MAIAPYRVIEKTTRGMWCELLRVETSGGSVFVETPRCERYIGTSINLSTGGSSVSTWVEVDYMLVWERRVQP
jgi:hypothetical protein